MRTCETQHGSCREKLSIFWPCLDLVCAHWLPLNAEFLTPTKWQEAYPASWVPSAASLTCAFRVGESERSIAFVVWGEGEQHGHVYAVRVFNAAIFAHAWWFCSMCTARCAMTNSLSLSFWVLYVCMSQIGRRAPCKRNLANCSHLPAEWVFQGHPSIFLWHRPYIYYILLRVEIEMYNIVSGPCIKCLLSPARPVSVSKTHFSFGQYIVTYSVFYLLGYSHGNGSYESFVGILWDLHMFPCLRMALSRIYFICIHESYESSNYMFIL